MLDVQSAQKVRRDHQLWHWKVGFIVESSETGGTFTANLWQGVKSQGCRLLLLLQKQSFLYLLQVQSIQIVYLLFFQEIVVTGNCFA